jgi:ATP-binding cassette subfamily C protein
MIAVAVFVLWQSASGDIVKSAGTIGIFLSGGLRLTASLLPLQSALLSIKQSIPMAEKALQFLVPTSKNETRQVVTTTQPASSSEAVSVSFEDVSFKYPGGLENTIRNITLAIKPGQQVAFIGPSGAGKSTVADLLLGLLTPTEGRVLVGGQEPTRVVLEEPGRLAYVPQRPGMISGTVSDNVALGEVRDQVDPVRLKTAIDASHLNQVLANLPEGVNTSLGKRKDELSGGQLQRIPSLLVMDEATSALDADSENEINKALDEMRGKVTVILIAHRLNTVQRSDVVFLVEEGRVTASGTFPELLRSNKTVQTLAKFMSISSGDHSRD